MIPIGVKVTEEKLGYQRVATISDTVDFASRNSEEIYREVFADSNIEVLTTEIFETGDTDFSAQLTRIMELSPDAIFVSAQQIEVIKILIQGRELGISADIPFISRVLSILKFGQYFRIQAAFSKGRVISC
ncbi:ABC transporter substrate-binding protein [Candidatus Poribacteria bacterium]|nr:ABC transporter substrate-binding protein [Candidatus Poribacteria bacterium]